MGVVRLLCNRAHNAIFNHIICTKHSTVLSFVGSWQWIPSGTATRCGT